MSENLRYETLNSLCYEEIQDNCDLYGGLYNQEDLMSACPSGWRVPSIEDYLDLIDFVGGEAIADDKLRAVEFGGSDDYGFSVKASPYAQYDLIGGPHYNYQYSDVLGLLMTDSENTDYNSPIVIVFSPDGIEYMSLDANGLFTHDEKTTCRCIQD